MAKAKDILDPAEYTFDDRLKAFFTGLKRWTDEFPTAMLHGAHGFEPWCAFSCASLREMRADIRRYVFLTSSQPDFSARRRFDVLLNEHLAV